MTWNSQENAQSCLLSSLFIININTYANTNVWSSTWINIWPFLRINVCYERSHILFHVQLLTLVLALVLMYIIHKASISVYWLIISVFQIITLPISIPCKPGEQQQTIQIQVLNPNSIGNSDKVLPLSLPVIHLAYNHQTQDGIQLQVIVTK